MTAQSGRIRTIALTDNTPTWFPANIAVSGTLTSTDMRVIGTGTSFRSQVSAGDFLINASNQARKVYIVISDTELLLTDPFTVALAGATCTKVKGGSLRHLRFVFTTNAGTVKTATQDAPAAWPAAIIWETPSTLDTYLDPVLVTPGAAGAFVTETL